MTSRGWSYCTCDVTVFQAEQQRARETNVDASAHRGDPSGTSNRVIETSRRLIELEQQEHAALNGRRHDAHAEKLRSNRDFLNESAYTSRCVHERVPTPTSAYEWVSAPAGAYSSKCVL